ncbi:MAG: protein-disulfide reductase DsbD N-terminal domain-containing protein, partial [Muribaculaceae bacterium]|nr:protein-disulfide reductase DsbD N-terminal domain-containing protein [Muribaculaceae bacterium]
MKRLFIATISIIAIVLSAQAQIERPVTWSSTIKTVDDKHVDLALTANIEDGWHMYSNSLPKGGPTPLTIDWSTTKGATPEGELKPSKGTEKQHDANFGMDLTWWTGKVTLTQRFKITEPQYDIAGNVRFMSCNDKRCVPPESWQFTHKGTSNATKNQSDDKDALAKSDETALESEAQLPPESPRARLVATNAPSVTRDELWAPVDT